MASLHLAFFAFFMLKVLCFSASELVVQLNVNRPLYDVNEKFLSFIMKPEDLYSALDGPYRKSMTKMAALMDNSYIKFLGDHDFTSNVNTNIKNPNKVIWKGFNRWSKAVNWTMIIPVPYQPNSWDPMQTLKILNSSHLVGINDCIWQLGIDFGSSNAADYVNELKTLNLMVDSFKPYVNKWQIMGADVSVGSSSEETRRYIEMSKDLNAAFGWMQPTDLTPDYNTGSYIFNKDPALQMLLSKKVPVWLSLPDRIRPKKNKHNKHQHGHEEDTNDALRWAQTLGDAASNGFDVVFQRINKGDWEKPDLSFFVTALYKKVMGSRVFPAKPLNIFKPENKLYSHCANAVSGGLAFMVVNTDEDTMHITLKTLAKLQGTPVWRYTLTMKKGVVLLNNNRVYFNATFRPDVKKYSHTKPIQLHSPGKSVSFWVFPSANLDHCQFTEVEEDDTRNDFDDEDSDDEASLSSVDKLLKSLIFESSLQHSPSAKSVNRKRRNASTSERAKRFILQSESVNKPILADIFKPFSLDEKIVSKRENSQLDFQTNPFDWLKQIIQNPLKVPDLNLLKRSRRNTEDYLQESLIKGPTFFKQKRENSSPQRRMAAIDWLKQLIENSKETQQLPILQRPSRSAEDFFGNPVFNKPKKNAPITKKIFDIRKPPRKTKPLFDPEDFDEEEFFKKLNDHTEPSYVRVPEGDVHIKHIANVDGDDVDIEDEETDYYAKKKQAKHSSKYRNEPRNEMKPLKLLSSEFFEAPSPKAHKPKEHQMNIGATLNSMLFPEPFTKKSSKENSNLDKKTKTSEDGEEETIKGSSKKKSSSKKSNSVAENLFSRDFFRSQRQLNKNQPTKDKLRDSLEEGNGEEEAEKSESPEESVEQKFEKSNFGNKNKFNARGTIFGETFEHLFAEKDLHSVKNPSKDKEETKMEEKNNKEQSQEAEPWWELSALRKKRSLGSSNFITKDEDLLPLGASNMPEHLAVPTFSFITDESSYLQPNQNLHSFNMVDTVRTKVTNIMDLVTRNVSKLYKAISKRFDSGSVDTPAMSNSISKF